ncbi:hypothetical protein [Actinophytocola sp.]|uniref:hypothetical protein n=1 Tax=Actinophytocola sp. TaxID=1872138 RepID=UPI0025BFF531|nr:hypothetical protein [Actinophytocola sp.]
MPRYAPNKMPGFGQEAVLRADPPGPQRCRGGACGRRVDQLWVKKVIAAQIGKSFQTVYREVRRNSKPDRMYQPFWAHNQAPSDG